MRYLFIRNNVVREMVSLAQFTSAIVATRVFAFAQGFLVMLILNRYSAAEMGGMALASGIGQVLIVISFSALIGIETEIARIYGTGDRCGIKNFLMSASVFACLVGIVMGCASILIIFLVCQFSGSMGENYVEALSVALPAVKVIGYGLPMYCIYLTASFYFEATHKPQMVTMLSIFGVGIGVVLALILIPDRLGLGLSYGMGAAWTLTLTRVIQGMVAFTCVLMHEKQITVCNFAQFRERFSTDAKRLLSIGVPMTIADCTTTVAVAGMTILVGGLGTIALNIYQISLHFLALLMLIGTGATAGITIRVTNAIGAKDQAQEVLIIRAGILLLLMIDAVILLLYNLFPRTWSIFYSSESNISDFVTTNQIWALLVFFIECPLILIIGVGRAKGITARLPAIKAACFALIAFPLCYVVTHFVENPNSLLLFSLVPTIVIAFSVAIWQVQLTRTASSVPI